MRGTLFVAVIYFPTAWLVHMIPISRQQLIKCIEVKFLDPYTLRISHHSSHAVLLSECKIVT